MTEVVQNPPEEEIDSYPPWNFSWVIPDEVAAMAYPRNKENLKFLLDEGIKHLITLSPEKKPPIEECPALKWSEVNVDQYYPPTIDNIKEFIDICKGCQSNGETIGIHCRQGRGRCGVMLACYMITFQDNTPDKAIAKIKELRPGSCQGDDLEQAVLQYYNFIKGNTKVECQPLENKAPIEEITKANSKVCGKDSIPNMQTQKKPVEDEVEEEIEAYPPWNFSWVIPNEVAAMAFPRNKGNLKFLVEEGVKHLITLSPEKKPPIEGFTGLNWSEVNVEQFYLPTIDNIKEFIDICKNCHEKREIIGIHCRQGRSRSGVMLACYLVAFSDCYPEEAVSKIRELRPGSCDGEELEQAVVKYYNYSKGITQPDYEEQPSKIESNECVTNVSKTVTS